ncbi:MAG: hypothetical protein AAF943_18655, partial [Pseudomonadota bacterium]
DLTVRNHLCAGASCSDIGTQTFGGSEALLLKDVNAWIKFEDSSASPGFPTNDWQIRVNDNVNSNENYMAFEDIDGGTVPFRVDAGARTNALRVTSDGKIGLGTGLPVRSMHIIDTFSPILRLETASASFLGPYTWDVAANGNGYYIEDVTSGTINSSSVPFKIFPGGPDNANNHAFVIAANGDVGLGTEYPDAKLHVQGTSMLIRDHGRVNFTLSDFSDPGPDFRTQLTGGTARFSFVGTGAPEMELFQSGDLSIRGRYISAGTQLTVPDYVFDDDYALRPLAEVQSFIDTHSHLPDVPSAADIAEDGLDLTEMQMTLLKKIEELTLYTLEQEARHETQQALIDAQQDTIKTQQAETAALTQALADLTAQVQALSLNRDEN